MDVFISHASENHELIENICKDFDLKGITYWVSYKHIRSGEDFSEVIPTAIQQSSVFLVFLSTEALESYYVRLEIDAAIRAKKTIIPVIIGDLNLPPKLEFLLSASQFLPYSKTPYFSAGLIARIQELLEEQAATTPTPPAQRVFHGDAYHPDKRKPSVIITVLITLFAISLLIGAIVLGISLAGRSGDTQKIDGQPGQSQLQNSNSIIEDTADNTTGDTTTNTTDNSTEDTADDTIASPIGVDELQGKYDAEIAAFDAMDEMLQQFRICQVKVGESKVPSFISLWTDSQVFSQNTAIAVAENNGIVITGVSVGETYIVCLPQPTAPPQVLKIIVTE